MTEHGPGAVPAELRAALEELAGTETLLVALDFDGVLAPIVPRAEDARPLPASAAAVAALADLPGRPPLSSPAGRWPAYAPWHPPTPGPC